ncbi:trypsin-like peptidase domain-containing protein [Candidatus Poribacteria bacterium]|nr:trypsin-like peptidase domain-containing protein [Candidatus Poribacteria bacterium]
MSLLNEPTHNNTEWHVSEEPRTRLGKGIIGKICFSSDGTQLAVGSSIGIWIYNAYTGKELNVLTGYTEWPGEIAYSPDGYLLASGGKLETGKVCLWDPYTGKHKKTLGEHEGFITYIEFSPDGNILASGSIDETIKLWDVVTGNHKTTLTGHTGGKELLAFSPDGQTLASATDLLWSSASEDDYTIRLWDTETGKHKATLTNPNLRVNSIAFSPDGETIVCGGWEKIDRQGIHDDTLPRGTVQLWDTATGEHKETLIERYSDSVLTVGYSPNGSSLVSGSKDGTILLWDTTTYQLKASLKGDFQAIVFSPDSRTLAITPDDQQISLLDAVTGDYKVAFTEHTDSVYNLVFNPDGNTIAGIGEDSTIRLWDVLTGGHMKTITGHTRSVSSISFNTDGSNLAVGSGDDNGTSGDKIIRILNVDSGCLQKTFEVPIKQQIEYRSQLIDYVIYSPNGKTLAIGSEDGIIRILDVESEEFQDNTFNGFRGISAERSSLGYSTNGLTLAFSPDSNTLASVSRIMYGIDNTIQLWDVVNCDHKATLTTGYCWTTILSIAFSPDGRTIAGGSDDGKVYLWDVDSGELKTTPLEHERKFVFSVAFSPDGRTLASGARVSGYGTVSLWDIESGECKAYVDMHSHGVSCIAFNPNGSILAIGGNKGIIILDIQKILYHPNYKSHVYLIDKFDETGRYKVTLKGHTSSVSSVVFSSDGRTLASGGKDGTILFWDIVDTLQTPQQIANHSLGSIVLVVKNRDLSSSCDPFGIKWDARFFKYTTGNGFFVKPDMIITYTHLWTSPGFIRRRLFGDWINQIATAKKRVINEKSLDSLALFHTDQKGYIDLESIAANDDQLALLKVSNCEIQPLYLSDDRVQIGDTVYIASTPNIFSDGIVSSIVNIRDRIFYQITTSIPYGCNGCPVLNSMGQVIGVAMATRIDGQVQLNPYTKLLHDYDKQNSNYAIPSFYIRELLCEVE